jgi:hypothetical protein
MDKEMTTNRTMMTKLIMVDTLFSGGLSEKIPPTYSIKKNARMNNETIDAPSIATPCVCDVKTFEKIEVNWLFL